MAEQNQKEVKRHVLFDDYILLPDGSKLDLLRNGRVAPADTKQWSYHFHDNNNQNRSESGILDSYGNFVPLLRSEKEIADSLKQSGDIQVAKHNEWSENFKNRNVILESASGANVQVLFEFPSPNPKRGSKYMLLPSIVSLSCSVSRAKMPVVTLGECTTQGFALGNKTVAGSIIKALLYNDEFDKAVQYYKSERTLYDASEKFGRDLSSKSDLVLFNNGIFNITQKQFLDEHMRDDLIPFNIFTYSFSEYGLHKYSNSEKLSNKTDVLMNSIYGCTIINEGQVQSIENLITENTFTYVAKYARLGHTLSDATEKSDAPSYNTTMTGSNLIYQKKKGY